jgi:Ca2+-transporting ATPase
MNDTISPHPPGPDSAPWAQTCAAALQAQASRSEGLSTAEAQLQLRRMGPNQLLQQPARAVWLRLLDQFRSVLVLVLLFAALLAGVIGDVSDSIVIVVVLIFNALLGFYQEFRAEKSLQALKDMLASHARVLRDGQLQSLACADLVPGDIVLLEAGDKVPADGRLLLAANLEVVEAALTGESQAAGKHTQPLPAATPLAERSNMLFMNTVVSRGRAELLVTATGMATEMGRITGLLQQAEEAMTPLQQQLDTLGRKLAQIAGAVVTLIFLLGWARGEPLSEIILTSIALAVAAIPEGLPAVVTVTLALGMRRMARQQAILKKLAAVETLGCTTVICSDKTGTLTLNQMTARQLFFRGGQYRVSGQGYHTQGDIFDGDSRASPAALRDVLLPLALCNEARLDRGQLIGDPTEGALLALACKGGLDVAAELAQAPRVAELPFDSEWKFMATFHQIGDMVQIHVKGAPDVLLARCRDVATDLGPLLLDEEWRQRMLNQNGQMAQQALRVLAVARKLIPASAFDRNADLLTYVDELELLGLVGLIDPPRPEAREAIALCRRAGIKVKMITGDHKLTAAAIAHELGLEGEAISGDELDGLTAQQLQQRIGQIAVFARVTPEHKVRLVQTLRGAGHVVAMTGDGVNDAPALKSADIGVAMGITGTEVAKEASSMVLADDNFATIVNAVSEGRTIYDNIVKFVRFQLSTNVGAILSVLSASLLGLPAPFTAIQILWINIIMDGPPALTLGLDPARPGIMHEAPRSRDQAILGWHRFGRLALYGATMAAGTLALFVYAQAAGRSEQYAHTLAFSTFVLFQFFNIFNARAEFGSVFNASLFRNVRLWGAIVAVLLLQLLVVHWRPAQQVFATTDLLPKDWALAFAVASSVLLLDEGRKLLQRHWPARRG